MSCSTVHLKTMSEQLKYGMISGDPKSAVPVTMAAGQYIKDQSGRFVYMNDGAATLCDDSIQTIFGHLESEEDSSTSADVRNCIIDLTAIFRIPVITGTYVVGMVGDVCDIDISSNVQGVDLTASSHDLVVVVGGSSTVYVDVMMNPKEWGTAAGTDD